MTKIKSEQCVSTQKRFKLNSFLSVCLVSALLTGCTTSSEKADNHQNEKETVKLVTQSSTEPQVGKSVHDSGEAPVIMADTMTEPTQVSGVRMIRERQQVSFAELRKPAMAAPYQIIPETNSENYAHLEENAVRLVSEEPVSTFSIDVDTASYSNVRRMLNQGVVPPSDAVRTEEFVNYFDYNYALPDAKQPFSLHTDVVVSPWHEQRHLMRVALKGFETERTDMPGANLVFLIDVSGSMNSPNKLPLLTRSLKMLTRQLSDKDSVAIVVYAGASGVVLEPTVGDDFHAIAQALDRLSAGGSTNGASGIELAYSMAQKAFIEDGINRVILATDGDFNVGLTDHHQLIDLIERKRELGVALSVLGFGQGNYNDHLTEQLADAGNGNVAYIDNINEARKVLVDEMHATLQTIAKDVKIQIEFNPEVVAEYRLIGYENRHLNREDFNNDKVDAGEIGAGHTVTAFYELVLNGSSAQFVDKLRYQNNANSSSDSGLQLNEIGYLKVRYKAPNGKVSKLLSQAISKQDIKPFESSDSDFKFATSVVGFASLLKQSDYTQNIEADWLIENAVQNKGADHYGYRAEFTQLMRNYFAMELSDSSDLAVPEKIRYAKVDRATVTAKAQALSSVN